MELTDAAFHNLRYLRMNARRQEHLASLLLPLWGRSVLEVGAGIGDHTHFFLDRACTVTSTEARPENVEAMRARYARSEAPWPAARLNIVAADVYDLVDNGIAKHDVVYCYGLLYHLEDPSRAIAVCAELCADIMLVETRVEYGDAQDVVVTNEDASLLTTSLTGRGTSPTRRFVYDRLKESFPHVYMPLTQPVHEQFRLDWRAHASPPGFNRAIFIGSHSRLENALLVEGVPLMQYAALPNVGSLTARRGTIVAKTIFGPIVAFADDLITTQLDRFGAHTRNELAMVLACLDPGDLVIDVGAHIGTFTLPFAAVVGASGRVVAVEQDAETFAVLETNVGSRDARNVALACSAVGDPSRRYRSHRVDGNTGASYLTRTEAIESVAVLSLDAVRAIATGAQRAALVKLDVEGMELDVLRSGTATIERDRPLIYLELSPSHLERSGASVEELDRFLRTYGYRFFRNVAERNSSNDEFSAVELQRLTDVDSLCDVLAFPIESDRIGRIARPMQKLKAL